MLVANIAAIKATIGVVARFRNNPPTVQLAGTAVHVGNGHFITANHIFTLTPLVPGEVVQIAVLNPQGLYQVIGTGQAQLVHQDQPHDLAVLDVPGVQMPAATCSVTDEPDGTALFTYGFPNPGCKMGPNGPIFPILPRASSCILSAHFWDAFEIDSDTYPGESGAPVFRHDNVAVAIVSQSKLALVPDLNSTVTPQPQILVRGPTLAAPLLHIASTLAQFGIV